MHKIKLNGGGRLKKTDVQFLEDVWFGNLKEHKKELTPEVTRIYKGRGENKREVHKDLLFPSARGAFAYHALRGDKDILKNLTGKLFADKKYIEGAEEDGSLLITIKRYVADEDE